MLIKYSTSDYILSWQEKNLAWFSYHTQNILREYQLNLHVVFSNYYEPLEYIRNS